MKLLKPAMTAIIAAAKKIGGLTAKLFASVKKYTIKAKRLFIGKGSAKTIGNLLKRGEFSKAFSLVSTKFDPKSLTKASVTALLSQVRKYPAYVLTRIKAAGKSIAKGAEKVSEASKNFFKGKGSIKSIEKTIEKVPKASRLRRCLNWIAKNKSTIFKVLGIGIPLTWGIVEFLERYRRANSGCVRYESTPGGIKTCKVNIASCQNKDHARVRLMDQCIFDILPDSIKNIKPSECNADTKTACLHCDSAAGDPEIDNPAIEYVCEIPTIFDTITTVMGGAVETVVDDLDALHSGIVSATSGLFGVLKYAIPVVGGICAVGFGIYVYNLVKSGRRGSSPELTAYRRIDTG